MNKWDAQTHPAFQSPSLGVSDACSLVELLRIRAAQQTQQIAYTYLVDGETQEVHLSYGELDRQARTIAARLQALGLQGERAVLLYPQGLEYIAAFFGCLYAGVIAVPAYPPRNKRHIPRLQAIIANCQAAIILSTRAATQTLEGLYKSGSNNNLPVLQTDNLVNDAETWCLPEFSSDDVAFLQYTSGSTGNAKGVMVSHANLMANQNLIKDGFGHGQASKVVGWLPFYHDMGLIGNIMQPLFIGAPAILMSSMAFLEKPFRWLQAISKYRAHTSGGPNFAFDFCVQKISAEEKSQLDLSSWQVAFNGSEPIHAATLDRFAEAFACCGFKREAFYPCYGLAESTLLVTGGSKEALPRIKSFNKTGLETHIANSEIIDKDDCRRLVGCGVAGRSHQVRIVGPDNQIDCEPGRIGEIQVGGASVAQGYWQNELATAETFIKDDNNHLWLRTGDLGFIDNGELFVAGRLKDLIIIRGCNYYPHDIEIAAETAVSCINAGSLAAFAVTDGDEEKLVLLAEVKRSYLKQIDFNAEFAGIRKRLVDECGLQANTIAFVKPGAILKTTSGKIRRSDCKKAFENQQLDIVVIDKLGQQADINLPETDQSKHLPKQGEAFLLQAFLLMPPVEATKLLADYLSNKIQILSGLPNEQMDLFAPVLTMGIDSLKAMELKYFIDDSLAIDLPVSLLLDDKSTMELAEYALSLVNRQSSQSPNLVNKDKQLQVQTLSLGQQAIWTVCQLEANTVVYNLPIALRIDSEIDVEAFRSSLCILINRHEQLRTGYKLENGLPTQILLPETEPVFTQLVCRDEQDRSRKIIAEIYRPFNLEHDQKLRTVLFSTTDNNHILLFCAHHIAVDFRAMVIMTAELKTIYSAQVVGQQVDLPILSANYHDYINWQEGYLASETAEQALDYWQQQLVGELPKLQLPFDKTHSNTRSYHGGSEALTIDSDTTQKLQRLAKENGVTLYILLLTVFKVLLYRYSGQKDIVVGSPTVGRPKKCFADLVGFFVNPVAIRTFPDGDKSFIRYLQEVKETVRGALQHQDYPLSLLVEKLQPEREGGISPFYRVCFVLQGDAAERADAISLVLNMPDISLDWPGLNAKSIVLPEAIAQFDINLMMAITGNELSASFQYSNELFEQQTLVRMIGHFQCLLQSVLENPSRELSILPILTESERHRQLVEWNSTRADYPEHICIHQLFEQQVAHNPAATAVVYEGEILSYSELNQRANKLAHRLISLGIRPDDRVAICVERNLSMIISILAILKAGGAYVPLDPAFPKERLLYMVGDSVPAAMLTQDSLLAQMSQLGLIQIPIIGLGSDGTEQDCQQEDEAKFVTMPESLISNYPDCNPAPRSLRVTGQNLAYVIYTSGSTGQPKGVMIEHLSLVNFLCAMIKTLGMSSQDKILAITTLSFDIAGLELFLPLITGAKVILISHATAVDSDMLQNAIVEHKPDVMQATPATWQLLLNNNWSGSNQLKALCGGEALTHGISIKLRKSVRELWNLYGPTEATVWSACKRIEESTKQEIHFSEPIGYPIANTQIYILDDLLQPVPVGVTGELYIGGVGLARGYISRPELTAERFIPHPYTNKPGDRLYRTGDLARYRADGIIEYLGRNDTQVKIRGFRIELGEIESRLLQHTIIKEAVVLANDDQPDNKRLIAYLVTTTDHQVDAAGFKAFLKQKLPDYMIPTAFIFLSALPLTTNGKLDRKALLAMAVQGGQRQEYVAPRDEAEQAIVDIWQQILGVERLGIYDDFFDLGGHSLSAVQIIAKIQESFAITVPVKTLFEAPTIAEFVDRIAEYQED